MKELKKMLDAAIAVQSRRFGEMSNSTNPQVLAVLQVVRGRLDVLEAVREAVDGNVVQLRILGE